MKELSQAEIERRKKFGKVAVTHGMSKTPEHNAWLLMHQRCSNPKNPAFCHYGNRGITVCERWNDFSAFLSDMGTRPSKHHSIERINNELGYSPDNCKWIPRSEQSSNTRRTIWMLHNGEAMCLKRYCELNGLLYRSVITRLQLGWNVTEAVKEPIKTQYRNNRKRNERTNKSDRLAIAANDGANGC